MSEATDMLGDGLDVLLGQHGVTFTVSGVVGTFSGIPETPLAGSELTTAGIREVSSLSLTFALDAGYTPATGDVVTAKGQNWVVVDVGSENASYVVRMEGRSQ